MTSKINKLDTRLEVQIIIIQVSINYNKKFTDKKQKETYAKFENIDKWMENMMN